MAPDWTPSNMPSRAMYHFECGDSPGTPAARIMTPSLANGLSALGNGSERRTRRMLCGFVASQIGWLTKVFVLIFVTTFSSASKTEMALSRFERAPVTHYIPLLLKAPAFLYFCNLVRAVLFEEDYRRALHAFFRYLLRIYPCLAENDYLVAFLEEAGGRAIQHYLALCPFKDVGAPQH